MSSNIAKRTNNILLTKELLATAFSSSSEAIVIKDRDGTILIGSQSVADFYRCTLNELVGRNAYQLLPQELASGIKEKDELVVSSGKTESTEETWDLGYEKRTFLVSRSPIRNVDGEVIGIFACYTNISHIKQAFLLFEQNQKRFVALAETCPVGIFECNPVHQLTYVNPEWERITGLSPKNVIGKRWTDFISAASYPLVKHLLGNDDSQPGGDRVDCTMSGPHTCTVELSLNRVSDAQNYTVSYIGSIVDLTYRLSAEQELREKANLLRDLTSSVPAIIWQLSLAGECVFVSDYFETVTGVSIDTVLGKSWEKVIHEDDFEAAAASLGTVFSGQQKSARHEFRMRAKAGDWRWMLTNCQPIHSFEGRFLGVAGHTIDITDRRSAEVELQQHNLQLEERVKIRTQELVNVNESLLNEIEIRQHAEELLEEKRTQLAHFSRVSIMGRLSGELAHELNQPLNAMQNYVASLSKILTSSPASDATLNVLARLSGEVTRAAKIIRRTRDFVSTAKHLSERLSLSELVSDTAAMLKGEARRRGMTIQIVDANKNLYVLGDPVRLQQVLVNLVLNALEAMVDHSSSGRIATVELSTNPNRTCVAVIDSGCGVPESKRSSLFEAFYTTKPTGLGMGLAISRGIVEEHGGTLNYKAMDNGGSMLVMELPTVQ